eukprot:707634-Prymnesium_polylepis.1
MVRPLSAVVASLAYSRPERERQHSRTTQSGWSSAITADTASAERADTCDVPRTKISCGST